MRVPWWTPRSRTVFGLNRADMFDASLLKLTVAASAGSASPQPVINSRASVPGGPDFGCTEILRFGSAGGTQHLPGSDDDADASGCDGEAASDLTTCSPAAPQPDARATSAASHIPRVIPTSCGQRGLSRV